MENETDREIETEIKIETEIERESSGNPNCSSHLSRGARQVNAALLDL